MGASPNSGTYELTTPNGPTALIPFDSSDLATSAANLQAALDALYPLGGVTVTVMSSDSTGSVLRVTWGSSYSTQPMTLLTQAEDSTGADIGSLTAAISASSPAEMVVDMNHDGTAETLVQGVRPVDAYAPYSATLPDDDPLKVASDLYTFRVNVYTANAQTNPSVGMDALGNFTIAWTDHGQPVSYFNGIYMRQFSSDGSPNDASDVMVSPEDTTVRDNSSVVMSADGHALVMWVAVGGPEVFGMIYDVTGTAMLTTPTDIAPASSVTACFDGENNIAFSFTMNGAAIGDVDYTGLPSDNVYMEECSTDIFVEAGQAGVPLYILPAPPMLRALERVNDTGQTWFAGMPPWWANDQENGQILMDPDGDLTVAYDGFGPDTNADLTFDVTDPTLPAAVRQLRIAANNQLQSLLAAYAAESGTGLSAAQIAWLKSGLITFPFVSPGANTTHVTPTDVNSAIDEILLNAQAPIASNGHGFTDQEAGRLRAILEDVVNLDRGEGSAVMYSQWDADPTLQTGLLETDDIVNSQRDGNNAQFIITVEKTAALGTGGNGTLDISIFDALTGQPLDGGAVPVAMTPHYAADGTTILYYDISAGDAQAAIQAALAANPYCIGLYQAQEFVVRQITDTEMQFRTGTKWDVSATQAFAPTYVFEVSFMGDLHDTPLVLTVAGGGVVASGAPYAQGTPSVPNSSGSVGTPQYDAMAGITREGSFTVTYLQDNLDAAGNVVSTGVYFRVYNESTDTAGPMVTDVTLVSTDGKTSNLNVSNTATLANPVSYAVVNVSEALYDNLTKNGNAASNPANYVLYDSTGKAINGAISAVYFGLDEAANLAQMAVDDPADYGPGAVHDFSSLSLTPSGKYEIVVAFDANGPASGVTPLSTGTYTLDGVGAYRGNDQESRRHDRNH